MPSGGLTVTQRCARQAPMSPQPAMSLRYDPGVEARMSAFGMAMVLMACSGEVVVAPVPEPTPAEAPAPTPAPAAAAAPELPEGLKALWSGPALPSPYALSIDLVEPNRWDPEPVDAATRTFLGIGDGEASVLDKVTVAPGTEGVLYATRGPTGEAWWVKAWTGGAWKTAQVGAIEPAGEGKRVVSCKLPGDGKITLVDEVWVVDDANPAENGFALEKREERTAAWEELGK